MILAIDLINKMKSQPIDSLEYEMGLELEQSTMKNITLEASAKELLEVDLADLRDDN